MSLLLVALARMCRTVTQSTVNDAPLAAPPVNEQRRHALKGLGASLASFVAACGGGGSGDAEARPTDLPPASPGSAATAPPPPVVALPTSAPPGTAGAYRSTQAYLFDSIVAPSVADRIGAAAPLTLDLYGPTRLYADFSTGWLWKNPGGDWIDSALVSMGSSPWASVSTPAAKSAAEYSTNITAALQLVQTTGRWNAWIVRRTGVDSPRTLAGRFHSNSAYRPRISVSYADKTTATLACRVSAFLGGGNTLPLQGAETMPMNAALGVGAFALEFDLPTKAVASATIHITVTNHWSGASTLEFNLASPPLNTDPVGTGIAEAYPLDAGLSANPAIIGVHRYVDGSALADFVHPKTVNPENDYAWSPDVAGSGAADMSKLPYLGLGKFTQAKDYGMTLVPSAYSGNSFKPLAAGIGALRVAMPKGAGITDGWEGGQGGTAAADAFINMPIDKIGTLSRIFVRYYLLIGTTADTGNPYRADIRKKYEVRKFGNPAWTDMGGKLSVINPAHKTKNGGNSGTSGGGRGWVLRPHWTDYFADSNSPAAGGWLAQFQWDDFQNNPVGYNYDGNLPPGCTAMPDFVGWGQRGGFAGVLYAGRWYCIEQELKLNSVNAVNPADGRYWAPDGECRVWVDGRLAYEVGNLVMRTLPAVAQPAGYLQTTGRLATLGVKHLWFNWFHGGTTQNSMDRVIFVSGLAWGTSRIGPMKI